MVVHKVICSAPGSTMVLGEHAVLHGHPAIVAALQSRIQIAVTATHDGQIIIQSELSHWQADLGKTLEQPLANHPLRFVLAALQHYGVGQGFIIVVESGIDATLGLGSSAALTVALVGALRRLAGLSENLDLVLKDAVALIQVVQGCGSGADAAASCYGGLLYYQANNLCAKPLLVSKVDLPPLLLLHSGYKTATAEVIARVVQWQAQDPQRYEAIYRAMGFQVDIAKEAIQQHNWQALAQAMTAYQVQMQHMGVSDAGMEAAITSVQQQASPTPGKAQAVKIAGSGLGDCVLCLGIGELAHWPHAQLVVKVASQGLLWLSE